MTDTERFWVKVDRREPDECWPWLASRSDFYKQRGAGYGRFRIGTRADGYEVRAHRYSWELLNGPVPQGMCVLHRCDNPACVNPKHLFLGTMAENTRDMIRKGRESKPPIRMGEQHHRATISNADVVRIRLDQRSSSVLAREFGVSYQTIYRIRKMQSRAA